MRSGFVVPNGDAADIAEMAVVAEATGWDALFVWEGLYGVDAWVALGVAAARTTSLRLGTMLTPISRRKPWELAGQVATVDRLSAGRVTLSVGLGAIDSGFAEFGEECDRRTRAELMDESLEIIRQLWTQDTASFTGKHYTVRPSDFPSIKHVVQRPHPPVWCVGALDSPKSMARALRWNGLIPQVIASDGARQATLEELSRAMPAIRGAIGDAPFDIVVEGNHDEHSAAAWFDAGATWWVESLWEAVTAPDPVAASLDRLREGPPSVT
ncbi:MAG: class flavin-dependent oxidoreductase [Acidimicrobiales bacterium]|nr:class flavin-dependent oxidoreductase [Acidimicrobiales bacterium]